ncbi:MAG: hypothetical protein H7Z73_03435 [Candidatus Saccharibacteria bacterium]|nr:hypothetical protein [Moraxellaceae bacterium]
MNKSEIKEMDRDQIKHMSDSTKADLNADPITGEPGSHIATTTVGAGTGVVVGGLIGSVAGPLGALAGAALGTILGAELGHMTGEAIEPTVEAAYWREAVISRPYYLANYDFERDYHPAYRLGYEARRKNRNDSFSQHEETLRTKWEHSKADSRLGWEHAKQAARDAWERITH